MTKDLTIRDAAVSLNCSTKVVYQLASSGRLPGYKVGRSWRFRPHVIEAFKRPVAPPVQHHAPINRVTPKRSSSLPGWNDFA